ncbi:DUF898 domain-containing protein [Tabrizicola sp. TH137]|uniref:DUF898 family protein n=1 Tax=Tabrizicola sp. TH137 TaxID=2067452 RepID=UPI000C7E2C1C|nr:DUF898 family protein [Tabrizicola sp. TH137]PLL11902.1 DUF898 domain-containing protein [Tabrizicola sp. TH137]
MDRAGELQVSYRGDPAKLFPLALGTGVLGVVTLGIYRFWAKARIRRHVWEKVRVGDDAMEFTGTGLEMFLGFLMAVVVLAVYLAVVQLILFAVGIRFVLDPQNEMEEIAQGISIALSFLAVLPLMLFAAYRARRYKLARTRFRGIRFAMENAAGGYMLRGLIYLALTVVSLGLLWPLMTYRLEAYMTERTWYGGARFRQGGRWTGLYSAYFHVVVGIALIGLSVLVGIGGSPGLSGLLATVGAIWGMVGLVIYRVRAFGYLMSQKEMDGGLGFRAAPRAGRVVWLYIKGVFIVGLLGGVASAIIFAPLGSMMVGIEEASELVQLEFAVLGVALYLLLLTVFGALALVFISQPILGHFVESVTVTGAEALDAVRQRVSDRGADAEGLADALDMGGAF